MKLITRDTDYAIRALCYIAKHADEVVSAKELVSCLRVPRPFLRKILQMLNKKKILKSYRGLGGGFRLASPAYNIRLIELIEIFQGRFSLSDHTFKKKICPEAKRCPLKKKLDIICTYVRTELGFITIASLVEERPK